MNTNKPVDKEPYEVPAVSDILPVTMVYGDTDVTSPPDGDWNGGPDYD